MAISFVGQVAKSVFAGTSTQAYTSTAGNTLILALQHQTFTPTITDSAGNTWVQGPDTVVDGTVATAEKQVGLWYSINATPITSITVTTSGSGNKAIQFNLSEWRGIGSLRAKASGYQGSGTASATAPVVTQTGDLLIGNMGYFDGTGRDDTVASGYTVLTGNAISTTYQSVAYQIASTTATTGPSYTFARSTGSGIAVASFMPAPVKTISIAATATYNPTGTQNPSTTGAVIPIPSGAVVGQYVISAVYFAQGTGPAAIVTPTNWTVLTPAGSTGTSANRVTILYGYRITDTTALSNLGTSFLAKVGYSSTRIVAVTHLLNNVDLNAAVSVGSLEFSASGATSITFNAPAAGDYKLYFPSTNSSAPTPNAVMTSTGGTKNIQVQSLDVASGSSSDSQMGSITGGTGITLSSSVPNHVSFGAGFMAAFGTSGNALPVAAFTHTESGVMTTVTSTSTDSDGAIASYDWDWGDGTAHATGANAYHTFLAGGAYNVTLTVTDNSGGTSSVTTPITVTSSWIRQTLLQIPRDGTTASTVNFAPATAGNLLVAIVEGAVTSTTPSGWTLPTGGSAVNFTGLYVWYKKATANESSFTTTHNGTNYPLVFQIFEFPSNYTFAKSVAATAQGSYATNPNLTGLTGTTTVFAAVGMGATTPTLTNSNTSWTASPKTPISVANLFVGFASSTDGYVYGLSYLDGYTATSYQPSHAIDLTGAGNNPSEALTFAIQAGVLPVASFTHTETGLVTSVNGTASSDTDGTIASYDWDWGDGSTHGTAATATHTYTAAGTYYVTLTVTDNTGLKGSITNSVVVPPTSRAMPHFASGDYATSSIGAGTSITVAKPTNTADGDLLVAYIYSQASSGTTFTTIPSGWTLRYGLTIRKGGVYTKSISSAAAETATSYTWSGASTGRVIGTIFRVTGADLTNPIDVLGTENADTTNATSITVPGLTPSLSNDLLLGFNYWNNSSTTLISTFSAAPGMTDGIQVNSPTGGSANTSGTDIQYQLLNGTTATGTRTPTLAPSGVNVNGVLLTIRTGSFTPTIGYAGTYRDSNGVNHTGNLFYWDGTTKHDITSQPQRAYTPTTVSAFLSPANAPWFAAHRGGSYNYPEETLYAYKAVTTWGIHAIEVSVQYSADGTPWCFHDPTTTRTTGVTGTISAMTDAAIAALTNLGSTATSNPSQPARPTAKLVDVLNAYYKTHVIIIEDKTYTHATAMLNLMDSYGTAGRPATEIFIWKADANAGKTAAFDPAASRGYHRWAYIFDSDMATKFSTLVTSGKADMIGMDFNSSDATLSAAIASCNANGVMPTGHILTSVAQRDRLIGLGMKGLMIANVKAVTPPWYSIWNTY